MHIATLIQFGREWLPVLIPIAVSVVSDLVVGLTEFPKADGALKIVLRVLNGFSVVVHKDSPGTLKALIVNSPRPNVVGSLIEGPGSNSPAVGLV